MPFRFSARWEDRDQGPNPLSEAITTRKKSGQPILDLTVSNPTHCGLVVPTDWPRLLDQPAVLEYDPQPQGILPARQAIADYYRDRGESVNSEDVFMTAGTSEGYSHLFKLFCDPGDAVLVPQPSYPLLETLASLEGLRLETYPLVAQPPDADGNVPWHLDRKALEAALTDWTKVLCVVQPNNPTGSSLSKSDAEYLLALAEKHNLALIVDEVFADYLHGEFTEHGRGNRPVAPTVFGSNGPLIFTLNGLSKILGLPQLKIAWIHAAGKQSLKTEAKEHLEWICDAYLSVGIAPQVACPELLRRRTEFQTPIQERLQTNLSALREIVKTDSRIQPLWPQGGWCIPVRCPGKKDDETLALELLRLQGVQTHPGYFFDFEEENILVLSLLTDPGICREVLRSFLPSAV